MIGLAVGLGIAAALVLLGVLVGRALKRRRETWVYNKLTHTWTRVR